jgi:alpha-L-rhamnosidase
MNSFNHYAIGSVGEWMYKTILGINPDEAHPGYKQFTLHPRPGGGLEWARGGYDSIRGSIRSAWKLEGDTFTLNVTIPANTTAKVYVPAKDAKRVTEGGKLAGEANGVKFERMEGDFAVYTVGSGDYAFVAIGG